jgi:tripartite-type tricarboxylate transporter receptor subunit TctC
MKRKSYLLSVVLLSVAISLTACGGEKKPVKEAAASPNEPKKVVDYPTKPIRMVVPFAPGGGTDIAARVIAEAARKHLPNDQTIVIENKPGGGGGIGTAEVVASKPDGYTLGMTTIAPLSILPHFDKKFTTSDITPVMRVVSSTNVMLVKTDAPWKTFEEWLDYLKANPGKFTYSTPGTGTAPHIAMEAFSLKAGVKTKNVPFEGNAPAITALLGGHVQGAFAQVSDAQAYTDSGKLRVIAALGKSESYPDAAIFKEKGIDVVMEMYTGIIAPKGLPTEIRDMLHNAFKKALEDPKVIETFKKQGTGIGYAGPDEFKTVIESNSKTAGEILSAAGLVK